MAATRKNEFAVLLFPPHGVPRVVEIPPVPEGMRGSLQTFATKQEAESALEEFFTKNPEYRNWKDGSIRT